PGRRSILDAMTLKPFGPHHSFIRSGSVKHFQTKSRGALNVRDITKSSIIVSFPSNGLRQGRAHFGSTIIIQLTPNLSASIPKRGEKNVLVSGIVIFPPADNALNRRSASASS